MPTVAIIATLDTKAARRRFCGERVQAAGVRALVIDTGIREPVECSADVGRERIAQAAGTTIEALEAGNDRGAAVAAMGRGLAATLARMVEQNLVHAVLGIGGSGGTSIAATAFRALPVGFPKMILSTVAAGNVSAYVGMKDIVMMPSVVDLEGLNNISIPILANAAAAAAGMAGAAKPAIDSKPLIAVTMFGVTTPCVKQATKVLEEAGYEAVVFHAVGSGGRAMETLIEDGFFAGVLDVTTTEWCDELIGGVLSAGPTRLDAAAKTGVPQVVCPGALDMVNFGPRETVPERFADRTFYIHNPQVTLMRTTPAENRQLGEILARKLNATNGPTTLCLPLRGVSAIDAAGQPFDDPEARAALFDALRQHVDRNVVRVFEYDNHINDEAFATAIAKHLLSDL